MKNKNLWYDKHSKKWRKYPHLLMINKGNLIYKCSYCGKSGRISELNKISCTERPSPCKWCGETPLCSPDCVGVCMALSEPGIFIAGVDGP